MKKVIGLILVITMAIGMIGIANAISYDEAYQTLYFYCEDNNGEKYLNQEVDSFGIYYFYGLINLHGINTEWNTNFSEDNLNGFSKEYQNQLEKIYGTEFGVTIVKDGKAFGHDVYHLTIAADIDLVDWIEDDQCIVDALVMFYEN